MARSKLTSLKQEVQKYLGIPYFQNIGKHKNSGDNVFVGKGTAHEIALKTVETANSEGIKLLDLNSQQIYNFQKKHRLGIDCSGLVCHLVNFYFKSNLDPRKTSATMLTSPPISKSINHEDATTGDLIRLDGGHHVMFIIEKIHNVVIVIHSSAKTKVRGVHYATIEITDPTKTLNHQIWSDTTLKDIPYSSLFIPTRGDGIFRPNANTKKVI